MTEHPTYVRQLIPLGAPRSRIRIHGIFVGIDGYLQGFDALHGCANDASSLASAFKLITNGTSVVLTNQEATRRAILTELEKILRSALSNDLVVFFYSSHGTIQFNDFYLHPCDADSSCLLASGFPFSVVSNAIGCFKGVRSLLIMDACQSGAIGFDVSRYTPGSESSIMVASQPSEASFEYEFDGKPQGAFTFALVRAIQTWAKSPDANALTLMNLFDSTYAGTKELTDDRQHPVLIGMLDTNLVLAERGTSRGKVNHPAKTPNLEQDLKELPASDAGLTQATMTPTRTSEQ